MYLKIAKYKQVEKPRWFDTVVTHIGLYKDDWTYVKFIKHDPKILEIIQESKIDITIPQIREFIKDEEIEKILPKESNLFDNFPLKWI